MGRPPLDRDTLLLVWSLGGRQVPRHAPLLLVAIAAVDLLVFAMSFHHVAPVDYLTRPSPLAQYLVAQPGDFRVLSVDPHRPGWSLTASCRSRSRMPTGTARSRPSAWPSTSRAPTRTRGSSSISSGFAICSVHRRQAVRPRSAVSATIGAAHPPRRLRSRRHVGFLRVRSPPPRHGDPLGWLPDQRSPPAAGHRRSGRCASLTPEALSSCHYARGSRSPTTAWSYH